MDGWMDGCSGRRPKQTPRNKDVVIATWNVRTMLKPGKMREIAIKRETVLWEKKRTTKNEMAG
jgi:hypothetical protein